MSLTIENLMSNVRIEIVNGDETTGIGCINFIWDEDVDDMIYDEINNSLENNNKKSLMWIKEVKQITNWKKDEKMYLSMGSNGDNYFSVCWSRKKNRLGYVDAIIEKNGFVVMKTFNNYCRYSQDDEIQSSFFIRVNSIHNDFIHFNN